MLKKFLSILVIGLWTVRGSAEDQPIDATAQKVEAVKPVQPAPCAPKQCPILPCPPKACCNPPPACCWNFNPCNPKGCRDMNSDGFYIAADFLYWRSENHGFSYAYELSDTVLSDNVGKVLRVGSDWDPGFRVGIGWTTTHDFWDIFLNYTWFQNDAKASKSSVDGFAPLWPLTTDDLFGAVSANTDFVLNMGDLELGDSPISLKRLLSVPI